MDIVLVSLPFVSLPRPSLALGLLKAALTRHGLESRVDYACLHFARRVGLSGYALANSMPANSLLGEWIFAGAVFPDFHPDHDAYLESLFHGGSIYVSSLAELRRMAWDLRRQAEDFLDQTARRLVDEGVRIVGATSTFQQNLASLGLFRRLKQLRPDLITVMGGGNCEGAMGVALLEHFACLDYVVSGEADQLVAPFFAQLLSGSPPKVAPPGVMSGRWTGAPPRASVLDMSSLPLPDYDDYFECLEQLGLRSAIDVSLPVENSRGCWWGQKHHCTFCGLNGQGMSFRARPPEQACHQFEWLSQRHRVRQFIVADNIMAIDYFKTVLPHLSGPYKIFYETKANLRYEQLQACARAGVGWIQPGLESLSDPLLKLMDKGTTTLQNLQTLKWARELGVHVSWLMLFAFPGDQLEWYEDVRALLPQIVHLQPPLRLLRVGYHRFSPYFEKAESYGLQLIPEDSYSYVYPFPGPETARLAYFFVDSGPSQQVQPILDLLAQPVVDWMARFWREVPILTLDDDGSCCEILDSRFGGLRRSRFEGPARQVLLACEGVRSLSALRRELDVPDRLLEELVEQGLLVRRDDHFLGLAVRGSLPPLSQEIPLGKVDGRKWPEGGRQLVREQVV